MNKVSLITTKDIINEVITDFLNEKLGVPENLFDVANKIYSQIVEFLDNNENEELINFTSTFYGDYKISDYEFNSITIEMEFVQSRNNEFELIAMGFTRKVTTKGKFVKVTSDPKDVKIDFQISIPNNKTYKDLSYYFRNNKNIIISDLSHELSHAYNSYKKDFESIASRSEYQAYTLINFNIPSCNHFLFYLYFSTQIENLVKPSEMGSLMNLTKLTQSQFRDFLKKSDIYQNLQYLKNFKMTNLIQEMHNEMPYINRFFEYYNIDTSNLNTDDEKIDKVLHYLYVSIFNKKNDIFTKYVKSTNPLFSFFNFGNEEDYNAESRKAYDDFYKKISKFKNKEEFFDYEEKMFNFVGDKMIRKLSKLYDMAKEDSDKSIINWNAYQRVNNPNQKFDENIKEKKDFNKKESVINVINEEIDNYNEYLKWKRKNITLRGVKETTETNEGGAMLGRGLYTAFLGNRALAKQYGKVYFVLNAIPKNPKVFNTLNDWEIWEYNSLIYPYLKKNNLLDGDYGDKRKFFEVTNIEDEMQKLGYDGIIIKGREMVNYNPPSNVNYFGNENQLLNYYNIMYNKSNYEEY